MSKEKVIILVACAFVIGLVAGVLITVIKTGEAPLREASQSGGTPSPPSAPLEGGAMDVEKARLMEQALLDKTKITPNDAETWTQLGNLYFDTNQYRKSIEAYTRSLELKPNDPNVMTDMGSMYRRAGEPQKAAEMFRKASQIDPRHAQSLFNLGVVLRNDLKDIPGASEAWEKYLQVDPTNIHASMVRSWIEEMKKSGQGAKK